MRGGGGGGTSKPWEGVCVEARLLAQAWCPGYACLEPQPAACSLQPAAPSGLVP